MARCLMKLPFYNCNCRSNVDVFRSTINRWSTLISVESKSSVRRRFLYSTGQSVDFNWCKLIGRAQYSTSSSASRTLVMETIKQQLKQKSSTVNNIDVERLMEDVDRHHSSTETVPEPEITPSNIGDDYDKVLLQPFHYITQIPGKEIRKKLAQAFNYWLNVDADKLRLIAEVVQMLHNASLLIDDIEDNAKLRRGVPVAHCIYGMATTINSANYAYFLCLEKVLELNRPEAIRVFSEQMLELHRGQGMEIYWRDNYICPTEEDYKLMVIRKTGGLFGFAVRLMQIFSECQRDYTTVTDVLGLYFQILDDYMNLNAKKQSENKSYFEDLTEDILRQRTSDVAIKKYAVDLLEEFGSFEYTRKVLAELEIQALDEINKLGGNPHMMGVLDGLCIWK